MKLKFIITQKWCHPEFGGVSTRVIQYELSAFLTMEATLKRLSKDDGLCQHTWVELVHEEGG